MKRKYQVFISSTFLDLRQERLKVVEAILEMGHIPTGMELFPASDDDQWTVIKKIIDECDYYVVILGGKYGSISDDGISFTEKEYDYALEKGIPTLGFVHSNPNELPYEKNESTAELRTKLSNFKDKVRKRLCKKWDNADNLCLNLSNSLRSLIEEHPRTGWAKLKDYNVATNRIEMWQQWLESAENTIHSLSAVTFSVGPSLHDSNEINVCRKFFEVIETIKKSQENCDIRLLTPSKNAIDRNKMNSLLWRRRIGFDIRIFNDEYSDEINFRYQVVDDNDVVLNIPNINHLEQKTEMSIRFTNTTLAKKLQKDFNKIWVKSTPFQDFILEECLLKPLRINEELLPDQLRKLSRIDHIPDFDWLVSYAMLTNRIEHLNEHYVIKEVII